MASEQGKFIRFSVDFEQREYERLRYAAEKKGWTKARIIRTALNRALKDVYPPTQHAR